MLTEGVDGALFDPHWPSRTTRLHEGTCSHRTLRIATQWRAARRHGLSFDTPRERRAETWSAPPRLVSLPSCPPGGPPCICGCRCRCQGPTSPTEAPRRSPGLWNSVHPLNHQEDSLSHPSRFPLEATTPPVERQRNTWMKQVPAQSKSPSGATSHALGPTGPGSGSRCRSAAPATRCRREPESSPDPSVRRRPASRRCW
jgi:hypothetical protein